MKKNKSAIVNKARKEKSERYQALKARSVSGEILADDDAKFFKLYQQKTKQRTAKHRIMRSKDHSDKPKLNIESQSKDTNVLKMRSLVKVPTDKNKQHANKNAAIGLLSLRTTINPNETSKQNSTNSTKRKVIDLSQITPITTSTTLKTDTSTVKKTHPYLKTVTDNNDIVVVVVKEVSKLVGTAFFDVEHVNPSRFVIDLLSHTKPKKLDLKRLTDCDVPLTHDVAKVIELNPALNDYIHNVIQKLTASETKKKVNTHDILATQTKPIEYNHNQRSFGTRPMRNLRENIYAVVNANMATLIERNDLKRNYVVHRYGCHCIVTRNVMIQHVVCNQAKTSCFVVINDRHEQKVKTDVCPIFVIKQECQLEMEKEAYTKLTNVSCGYAFKIRCASCLLTRHHNGFVCVLDEKYVPINELVTIAKELKARKSQTHHDHAQYLLSFKLSTRLQSKTMLPGEKRFMLKHIVQTCGISNIDINKYDLVIGHHLSEALDIMKVHKMGNRFAMITVNVKGDEVQIDLPGGKRHMGENTKDCAIRETEEETSLDLKKLDVTMKEYSIASNSYFFVNRN